MSFARHRRFTLGGFEVATLLAGTIPRADPHGIFGTNVSAETFAEVSAANFLSTEISQFFFTPVVVITHMHGDHIGGLSGGSSPTLPNARYVTGRTEYDHWDMSGDDGIETKVRPLTANMTFPDPDQDVVSGITSVAAHGHTPGHMGNNLESDGARLMLFADLANHPVWSLAGRWPTPIERSGSTWTRRWPPKAAAGYWG